MLLGELSLTVPIAGGPRGGRAATFGGMRMLLALAVAVVALAAPASARAGEAMLWACHGPAGQPLPVSFEASGSGGAFVRPTSPVPCQTPGDTIKLGFDDVAPPEGSAALLRVNTPGAGTTLEGVWLGAASPDPGTSPARRAASSSRSRVPGRSAGCSRAPPPARGWSSACAARRPAAT